MRFTLSQELQIITDTCGAAIVSFQYKGRDVVPSYEMNHSLDAVQSFVGTTIGHVAGRIHNGKCVIGDRNLELSVNQPPNHLHGGDNGFHLKIWQCIGLTENSVEFELFFA